MTIVWGELANVQLRTRILDEDMPSTGVVTLENDVDWVFSQCDDQNHRARVFVCTVDGVATGYAAFIEHPSALSFQMGEVTLWSHRVRRLMLSAGPRLSNSTRFPEGALSRLFEALYKSLRHDQVVFVQGVEVASDLGKELIHGRSVRQRFHVWPHGVQYQRRLISLPGSFEQYLGQLDRKTRENLRRRERSLNERVAGDIKVTRFMKPDEVKAFLQLAESISRKTYQWNLLGEGVHNEPPVSRRLESIAEKGWLLSYVLTCGGTPTAFMLGYLYSGTYFSSQIGYDPHWANWSVGNVLHCRVIRDLMERQPGVEFFDFMYGDNMNKAKLSNLARTERNFYLIPRGFSGTPLAYSLRLVDFTSQVAGHMLDRVGIKRLIRRQLRRRAAKVHLAEEVLKPTESLRPENE